MTPSARLPGIRFQAEAPQRDSDLPRMDVAAFVGFAASGPLATPVAVESAAEFRELFGGELPLAWDAEQGRAGNAHLGAAVESFFANGGRRAWIVRVAEKPHTFLFPLRGLHSCDALADFPCLPATARARSAGNWAARLAVGTALERRVLPLIRDLESPPADAFTADDGAYRLDVAALEGEIEEGELLELVFDGGEKVLYLEVDTVERRAGGFRLRGARGFWFKAPAVSPPEPDVAPALAWTAATAGLDAQDALAAAGSPSDPAVRRLRFEILVYRGDELAWQLGDLGFSPRHPRSWTHLPADADLYRPQRWRPPRPLRPEIRPLVGAAASPRFPLAGPEDVAPLYLPLGMTARRDRGEALVPEGLEEKVPALERDGLGAFSNLLFLDEHLAETRSGSLGAEMEHRYSVRGEALGGLHCLLPIEEVSLLALPDAVHPGWTYHGTDLSQPLAAPEDLALEIDEDTLRFTWAPVSDATAYRLERDPDPDFHAPRTLYEGPSTEAELTLAESCPRPVSFRVRALRHGERGPWSATLAHVVPAADFEACDVAPAAVGAFELVKLHDVSFQLLWPPGDGTVSFEVQESEDVDFENARTIHAGSEAQVGPLLRRDGLWCYRVRVHGPAGPGPWSKTVALRVAAGSAYVFDAWDEPRAARLLALQRAALRFCAARADLMAVLALPASYRETDALTHVAALRSALAGEEPVLRYGCLHHPWLVTRDERLRRVPPDGAVCGLLAALERETGAWRAPANRPFHSVAALVPALDAASWPRLFEAGLNLVRREPRGFLVLSSETLSTEDEHRPIEVRRLLILLRRLALAAGRQYVFEPHGSDLHARAARRFEHLLGELFVRGALAGRTRREAFRVRAGAAGTELDPGRRAGGASYPDRLVVELQVAPARALAFLTVRLLLTGSHQAAFQEV